MLKVAQNFLASFSFQASPECPLAMQDLKKRHGEHKAEVRRLSKHLQQIKRRARDHVRPMLVRQNQYIVARVLVCMNKGEPTAAVEYVSRRNKTRCWDAVAKGLLAACLRDWWRGTDDDTRHSHEVVDETNPAMEKAILLARRFAVECNLETWVDIQNVQKGINPTSGNVMQQANAVKTRLGVEASANRRTARRWLQRWRVRRGIKLRRGHVREHLSVGQMQRKARPGVAPKSSPGGVRVAEAPG